MWYILIADNVVDLSLVRSYLPHTKTEIWVHGQVLTATQESNTIAIDLSHVYNESLSAGMEPEDAVKHLKRVSQISNDKQVQTVAEALEFQLPALVAAASYVQKVVQNGCPSYSWTHYIMPFCCSDNK